MTKKRFTDCDKWDDAWFHRLKPDHKMLWIYLCDACDAAGVWEVNEELARFRMGKRIDFSEALTVFGDRIQLVASGGKWHLKKFIPFQYPQGLMEGCKPHKSIISLLRAHRIDPAPYLGEHQSKQLPDSIHTVQDKDKEKEKEKDRGSVEGESDRDVCRRVATWVRLRTSNPDDSKDDASILAGLIRDRGVGVVQDAAERVKHRQGRKAWVSEIEPELDAPSAPPQADPIAFRIAMVIDAGWERLRDRLPFAKAIKSEPDFRAMLAANPDALATLERQVSDEKRAADAGLPPRVLA